MPPYEQERNEVQGEVSEELRDGDIHQDSGAAPRHKCKDGDPSQDLKHPNDNKTSQGFIIELEKRGKDKDGKEYVLVKKENKWEPMHDGNIQSQMVAQFLKSRSPESNPYFTEN